MPTYLKNIEIQLLWPKAGSIHDNWTKTQVQRWVEAAGGRITFGNVHRPSTTHIVCESQTWSQNQDQFEAFCERKQRTSKLFVVTIDWLINCLDQKKKVRESRFLLSKATKAKKAGRSGLSADDDSDDVQGPAKMFFKHSKKFVDERDQEELAAKHAAEDAERAEAEARKRREEELEREHEARVRRETTALIRKGFRKSRNEIFSDEHHIYRDAEGFPYEITLTKVDISKNRNERVTITVYESNAEPHTYATNLNRAGTERQPSNNILVAIGSPFCAACRLFRVTFQELTHTEWEERFNDKVSQAENVSFNERPFIYVPPERGPKGDAIYIKGAEASHVLPTLDTGLTDNEDQVHDDPGKAGPATATPGSTDSVEPESSNTQHTADEIIPSTEDDGAKAAPAGHNDGMAISLPMPAMIDNSDDVAKAMQGKPAAGDGKLSGSSDQERPAINMRQPQQNQGGNHLFEDRNTSRVTTEPPEDVSDWAKHDYQLSDSLSDTEGPGSLGVPRKRKLDESFEALLDEHKSKRKTRAVA